MKRKSDDWPNLNLWLIVLIICANPLLGKAQIIQNQDATSNGASLVSGGNYSGYVSAGQIASYLYSNGSEIATQGIILNEIGTDAEFTFELSGNLTQNQNVNAGQLVMKSAKADLEGNPLINTWVYLILVDSEEVYDSTLTDLEGYFVFSNVPYKSYYFTVGTKEIPKETPPITLSFDSNIFIKEVEVNGEIGTEGLTAEVEVTPSVTCDSLHPDYKIWYQDADGDGYGNANFWVGQCSQPENFVLNDLDCNDNDANINPDMPEFNSTNSVVICEKELPYIFGGSDLYEAGEYKHTFTSLSGCDSVVTLQLLVNTSYEINETIEVCESDLPYVLGTQSISAAGVYTESFSAINGCDSTVTVDLTVNPVYNVSKNVRVKAEDLPYVFGNRRIRSNGTYVETFTSIAGCDSVVTLNLTVDKDNEPPSLSCNEIGIEIPAGTSYQLTESDIELIISGSSDNVTSFNKLVALVSPNEFTCDQVGNVTIMVTLTDAEGNEASCETLVKVSSTNADPTLDSIANIVVNEGENVVIPLSGISSGPDCVPQNLTISIKNTHLDLINSINLDYLQGESQASLMVDLLTDAHGVDTVFVDVEDALGGTLNRSFLLTVNPVNDPPVRIANVEDQQIKTKDIFSMNISKVPGDLFYDVDGDSLTYSLSFNHSEFPEWVSITEYPESYLLNFEPLETDTGCYDIVIDVKDVEGLMVSDTFAVCVHELLVGIDEITNEFDVNVYPNPTSGKLNLNLVSNVLSDVKVVITSIAGQKIFERDYRESELIKIDISGNTAGLYFVNVFAGEEKSVHKIVLQNP